MSKRTTIVLADDHPMFRLGLKTAIETDEHFDVIGQADDGQAALELIQKTSPDIAVVDWRMPRLNGLQIVQEVHEQRLSTRVIILTAHDEEALFHEALDAGVYGFVLKDNAVCDILESLRTVEKGEVYLSPAASRLLLKRTRSVARLRQEMPALGILTPMEGTVLKLVAASKTSKQIAAELGISPYTVETHRRNISQKLDLRGSHSLLQFAVAHREEL